MTNRTRIYTLVASLLLHALYAMVVVWLNLVSSCQAPVPLEADDEIVFELQPPPERQKPRTVIETPDDAEVPRPPERADFLSDKNARARNESVDANLDIDAPFARGDIDYPELPANSGPQGEPGQVSQADTPEPRAEQEDELAEPEPDYFVQRGASDFRREKLIKQTTTTPGLTNSRPRPRHDNQSSRAPDMGALSFNTYDWDFAPYMLALKRKVERNIFPPPAFTRLGLISGETRLRFKIYPNGEMRDLEILDYEGHKTLMETSRNAIVVSAPFPGLPTDFPEKYLEVTARFTYSTSRQPKQ